MVLGFLSIRAETSSQLALWWMSIVIAPSCRRVSSPSISRAGKASAVVQTEACLSPLLVMKAENFCQKGLVSNGKLNIGKSTSLPR